MQTQAAWRAMQVADLPAVVQVAGIVHPEFPEDEAVFRGRLALFAAGCHILESGGTVAGYLVSHPWRYADPPALNAMLSELPSSPSTFYIHDLAILPSARRSGEGKAMIEEIAAFAHGRGFDNLSLVALGGAQPFWRACRFEAVAEAGIQSKLHSYGVDACFMIRTAGLA
ncbi:GNAT family N-acetyltransferase [Sphingomonas sp. DT-204]|uniref:GNAT family N-acetyltransferase n=1 Tax=Sphingomonas sp. DT-204 TaxID=3396166 RepID=UPI003F1D7BE3